MSANVRRRVRCAVVAGVAGAVGLLSPSAASATFGAATDLLCVTPSTTVHFETARLSAGGLSGIRLSGLDSISCRGMDIRVEIWGNAAGDPKMPATEQLLHLDSELNACTDAKLDKALDIVDGVLNLSACPPGTDAKAFADATQVVVLVDGRQAAVISPTTSVLGKKFVRAPVAAGEPSGLAFTGYWTAWTFWLGFGVTALGGLALMLGRRRRRS